MGWIHPRRLETQGAKPPREDAQPAAVPLGFPKSHGLTEVTERPRRLAEDDLQAALLRQVSVDLLDEEGNPLGLVVHQPHKAFRRLATGQGAQDVTDLPAAAQVR